VSAGTVDTAATIDGRTHTRGALATLAHGLRLTPELRAGLGVTLALALLATAGRVVVPVAVQQTIDNGLSGPEPDLPLVRLACGLALLAVAVTAYANYLTNVRIYRTAENGLAALRVRASAACTTSRCCTRPPSDAGRWSPRSRATSTP
jgi:putative ABC transport system ATP-binding protein